MGKHIFSSTYQFTLQLITANQDNQPTNNMNSNTNTASSPKSSFDGERRRSSGGLFNNMLTHKRSPTNEAYAARRSSIEDQGPPKGMLGKMWDNAVRGVGPTAPK